jgi:hypothetical protein
MAAQHGGPPFGPVAVDGPGFGVSETKVTPFFHIGCGGRVIGSLDGEICARCSSELQPDEMGESQQRQRHLPSASNWSPSPGEPGYDPPDSYGGR